MVCSEKEGKKEKKEHVKQIIHRRNPSDRICQELNEGGKIINNEESHIQ